MDTLKEAQIHHTHRQHHRGRQPANLCLEHTGEAARTGVKRDEWPIKAKMQQSLPSGNHCASRARTPAGALGAGPLDLTLGKPEGGGTDFLDKLEANPVANIITLSQQQGAAFNPAPRVAH